MRSLRVLIPLSFLVASFFALFVFAYAQTDNEPAQNSAPQTDPVNLGTRAADRETGLPIKAQQRIINLVANVSNQIDATIRRYTNITNRLENRINLMKLEGYETTEAEADLALAKGLLETVFIRMITIDTEIYEAVTSETPREAWAEIRLALQDVRTQLHDLHAALNDTVTTLRNATVSTDGTTTTVDSSTAATGTVAN